MNTLVSFRCWTIGAQLRAQPSGEPSVFAVIYAITFVLLAGSATPAGAQSPGIESTGIKTCNMRGEVTLTVLGKSTTVPLPPCVNQAQQTMPGTDNKEVVGTMTIGLDQVANLATLSAPHGRAAYGTAPNVTRVEGGTEVDEASLAQDMVGTSSLKGKLICQSVIGGSVCGAGTSIASMRVNGKPIVLPPEPIPFNYTIPIFGKLHVTVLGISLVIPVSGSTVLNEVVAGGLGTKERTILHNTLSLYLNGGLTVNGLGLVQIAVRLHDSEEVQAKFKTFTQDRDCKPDEIACIGGAFAKCAMVMEEQGSPTPTLSPSNSALECFVLPL